MLPAQVLQLALDKAFDQFSMDDFTACFDKRIAAAHREFLFDLYSQVAQIIKSHVTVGPVREANAMESLCLVPFLVRACTDCEGLLAPGRILLDLPAE